MNFLPYIFVLFCNFFIFRMGFSDDVTTLYTDIVAANTTDSLIRIRDVALKIYEFKYDSVTGRRQLGVLGADAERYFPESVEVVPSYSLPSKERGKPPVVLSNFPVVDKTAIFMHGVAAIKELLSIFSKVEAEIGELRSNRQSFLLTVKEIESKVAMEMSAAEIEYQKLVFAETEFNGKNKEFDKIRIEELRNTINIEVNERKGLIEYQERLMKERMALEDSRMTRSIEEAITLEKELIVLKEKYRQETSEKLQSKRLQLEKDLEVRRNELDTEKIRAEISAKAEAERANEDVALRQLEMESSLQTERTIQTIKVISNQIISLAMDLLSRPLQLVFLAGIVISLISLYYTMQIIAESLRQFIQLRLGRPSLVRETSVKSNIFSFIFRPFQSIKHISAELETIKLLFKDVILSEEDKKSVIQLALTTKNTKRSNAPFRHVLLHGPPGTGKTLIARHLAAASGMDYAIMSGGDVGPLGEDAVTQLHNLFRWASKSPSGLLVFIDEAEAFLSSRSTMGTEEVHIKQALNALLYQTGTQSLHFMLVLATNRPEDLDSAILDRMDVTLLIRLPELNQRIDLLELYMQEHVIAAASTSKSRGRGWGKGGTANLEVEEKCLTKDLLIKTAKKLNGFSGREISKLMIALQYATFLTDDHTLTQSLFDATVNEKLKEHEEKCRFGKDG